MKRSSRVSRRAFVTKLGLASALVIPSILGLRLSGAIPAALAAEPVPALPVQSANVEVMVLHATNGRTPSVDPRVDEGKPSQPAENLPSYKLKNPPLSAYNTYALKDRKKVLLAKGTPQHVALPNGRTLELALVNVVQERNERRYTVAAAISQPGAAEKYMKLIEFTASAHQSVFVGGISFPTGSLVVAFTVEP